MTTPAQTARALLTAMVDDNKSFHLVGHGPLNEAYAAGGVQALVDELELVQKLLIVRENEAPPPA
jgi:hypothetical protein